MDLLTEWNEQLRQQRERLRLKEKRQRRIRELEEEIEKQERIAEECRSSLDDEREDVERLESASLPRVWYRLTGRLEERLEAEEKEAAEAQLRYDAAEAALRALESSRDEEVRQLAEVDDAEAELEKIVRRKEEWIRRYDPDTSRLLESLSDEAGILEARLKETQEAEEAGQEALSRLDEAREKLQSARNWGTYDMLGGGMISTHIKHNRIEEARELMYEAQHALRLFEKELADLEWRSGASGVEMGGFLTFADYFFDGFLTDWVVQGRINDAFDSVERGIEEVERQLSRLAQERARIEEELNGTNARYEQTIERR